MKVVVFGLGYVGFTASCCIASQGHNVVGIDVNGGKVKAIDTGSAPIVEPGVEDLLREARKAGRIGADTQIGDHLSDADMAIVCVGTPSGPDGSHNMSYIADVTRQIARAVRNRTGQPLTVVYRSTIRPGSIEDLILPIFGATLGEAVAARAEIVYNPEFLREGSAVKDFFNPPKIVMGTQDGRPNAKMTALNEGITAPTFVTGYREAEFTKFADNTWHAVKVAYANELGRVCLALGISAAKVHEIFVSDTKLNVSPSYLRPGGAFGGSCLPKDVRALQYIAQDVGENLPLVESLLRSNEAHKHRIFQHATEGLAPGARVLLAGLAFKAHTDDLRESPNIDLARRLLSAGYSLSIYDPAVDASKLVGANLGYAYSHLPVIERLLVPRDVAEGGGFDRVIAANATIRDLALPAGTTVVDVGALP
ncbi:MAG: nucleotide sugar dehydrogenase [Pseudomonadota bacterium]